MIKISILKKQKNNLNEVSYQQAVDTLDSSSIKKAIYRIYGDLGEHQKLIHDFVKKNILENIPQDIDEKQKAQSILWLKRLYIKRATETGWDLFTKPIKNNIKQNIVSRNEHEGDRDALSRVRSNSSWLDSKTIVSNLLEKYFQYKDFLEPEYKDLFRIEKIADLGEAVLEASIKYKESQTKKDWEDAAKGIEELCEIPGWNVYAVHNKGAACELGKGTAWCTAAPGLNYFEQYYDKNNPLFIFINKKDPKERYQFSYKESQFMDRNDEELDNAIVAILSYELLTKCNVENKYPETLGHSVFDEEFYSVEETAYGYKVTDHYNEIERYYNFSLKEL